MLRLLGLPKLGKTGSLTSGYHPTPTVNPEATYGKYILESDEPKQALTGLLIEYSLTDLRVAIEELQFIYNAEEDQQLKTRVYNTQALIVTELHKRVRALIH